MGGPRGAPSGKKNPSYVQGVRRRLPERRGDENRSQRNIHPFGAAIPPKLTGPESRRIIIKFVCGKALRRFLMIARQTHFFRVKLYIKRCRSAIISISHNKGPRHYQCMKSEGTPTIPPECVRSGTAGPHPGITRVTGYGSLRPRPRQCPPQADAERGKTSTPKARRRFCRGFLPVPRRFPQAECT